MTRVTWRGVTVDSRTAAMLEEAARLVPGVPVSPSQGSYSRSVSASGGTHDGGGAVDLRAANLTPAQRADLVAALRRVGFAAWLRTPAQADWPWHIHAVAVGCPDLSPAAARQVADYRNGLNGLAGRGRDDGPRDWVGVVWETYKPAGPAGPDTEKGVPTMFVGRAGRTAFRLVTGDRYVPITEQLHDALKAQGVPAVGIPTADHDTFRQTLVSEDA